MPLNESALNVKNVQRMDVRVDLYSNALGAMKVEGCNDESTGIRLCEFAIFVGFSQCLLQLAISSNK